MIGDSSESFISTPVTIVARLESSFANVSSPLERVAPAAPTGMVPRFDWRSSFENGVMSSVPRTRNLSDYIGGL